MMNKKRTLFVFAALLFALSLFTVSVVWAGSGSSLATNPNPVAGPNNQAPAIATGGSITITHSASQSIVTPNSVHCGTTGTQWHSPNGYYRVFDLANDFGITGQFDVTAVQYGIELAASQNSSSQPIDVNLYTLSGPLNTANLTLIGSTTDQVANQSATIFTSLVTGSVPPGSVLVVEVFSPDGRDPVFNAFYIGSNNLGETDPSYLRAPDCGISQPVATGTIGFPNMQIVVNVIGNEAVGLPSIAMTKTVGTDPAACATTSSISVDYGTTVYYCYTVQNTGNVTLTHHTVDDDVLNVVFGPGAAYDLAPGASTFVTASYQILTDTVTNNAMWTAFISGTNTVATATSSATVTGTPTDVALTSFGSGNNVLYVIPLIALALLGFGGVLLALRRQNS